MSFIREISVLGSVSTDKSKGGSWRGLASLIRRPWFGRRWITQEIVFARRAVLWCGHVSVSCEKFAEAVTLFETKVDEINELFGCLKKKEKTTSMMRRAGEYILPVAMVGASIAVQAGMRGGIALCIKLAAMTVGQMWNTGIKGKSEQRRDWQYEFPICQVCNVGPHSLVTNLVRIMKRKGSASNSPGHLCTIEALLSYLPTFKAREPTDVVFAIISLVKKPHHIIPDYTKMLPEICKEVVQDAAGYSSSLNVRCRP
ncbi:hypothetical protein B0J14DRAFT_151369 [Halenospora varia]|nr:hypothetical protein B0J14DRAFT_151369 [Halenospora varia]